MLVTDYTGSGEQVDRFAATFTRNARVRSWRSFRGSDLLLLLTRPPAPLAWQSNRRRSVDDLFVHTPATSFEHAPWTVEEREAIEALCQRHTPRRQRSQALGHGASAGLFFTHTSVPNNLPFILRRHTRGWVPFLEGRTLPADLAAELGSTTRRLGIWQT